MRERDQFVVEFVEVKSVAHCPRQSSKSRDEWVSRCFAIKRECGRKTECQRANARQRRQGRMPERRKHLVKPQAVMRRLGGVEVAIEKPLDSPITSQDRWYR